jgi:hypothetical protein
MQQQEQGQQHDQTTRRKDEYAAAQRVAVESVLVGRATGIFIVRFDACVVFGRLLASVKRLTKIPTSNSFFGTA